MKQRAPKARRPEKALRESQRTLSTLLDNLPGDAYRVKNDRRWTTEYLTQGIIQICGYRKEEFLNFSITWDRLVVPEDRDRVWQTVQEAVARKEPFVLEYRIQTRSGQERWVWEKGQGVFDANGNLEALEGFIMDVTARKHAEIQREESERKFRALFEAAADAILVTDPHGNIQDANPAAEAILARGKGEMVGSNVREFVQSEDRATLELYLETLLAGELINEPIEIAVLCSSGQLKYVQLRVRIVKLIESLPYLEIICYEVTEQGVLHNRLAERLDSAQPPFTQQPESHATVPVLAEREKMFRSQGPEAS